eukprot:TRINITY_DN2388_c0_g1_i1.p1 TRINITY_DN2388_c0_g1~~TRINITY_DN2388_c0_g1_i1.p1  ORF type:complete len:160 (-),score=16.33 TRINITY_DN2388_c0_g1_i1:119-598(-)
MLEKTVIHKNNRVNLQFREVEAVRDPTKGTPHYANADAILLCYDIVEKDFQTGISEWMKELNNYISLDKTPIAMVGMKSDLQSERGLAIDQTLKFAKQNKLPYYEVSAKRNNGVSDLFTSLTKSYLKRKIGSAPVEDPEILLDGQKRNRCLLHSNAPEY